MYCGMYIFSHRIRFKVLFQAYNLMLGRITGSLLTIVFKIVTDFKICENYYFVHCFIVETIIVYTQPCL